MARRGNSRKPKGGPGNHGRGDLHDAGEASNPLPAFNTLEIKSPPVSGRPRANDEQEKKKPQDLQQEYWDHFVKSAGAVTKKPPQSQPEVNIIANFLKSKVNIPSIHEYSLQFYQNKKSKRVEINKRSELPSAFEAFKKSEEINVLGNTKYFTDFSTLWCISPLANIVDGKMTTKPCMWISNTFVTAYIAHIYILQFHGLLLVRERLTIFNSPFMAPKSSRWAMFSRKRQAAILRRKSVH